MWLLFGAGVLDGRTHMEEDTTIAHVLAIYRAAVALGIIDETQDYEAQILLFLARTCLYTAEVGFIGIQCGSASAIERLCRAHLLYNGGKPCSR